MYAYKVTLIYEDGKNLLPAETVKYIRADTKGAAVYLARYFFQKETNIRAIERRVERIPLWVNEYVIQEHWGRWEDATSEDSLKEARARLKEYRENSRAAVRMITRKVINPLVENK